MIYHWDNFPRVKGAWSFITEAGDPKLIFFFLLFRIELIVNYGELLSESKNIIPSQSYHILKSQNTLQCVYKQ